VHPVCTSMQQQQPQHQGGGPGQQFGLHPPEMPPFSPSRSTGQQRISMAEAPSPISSRPPAPGPPPPQQQQLNNELAGAGAVGCDEEALAAGEEGLGGGAGGNRWPRQETLALLKIRSDMDAAFRDATLKGPLWEEVSRKLAEEGYRRNAKKCKEKFENVHKYYKRTKDSRAGRNDGKTYRFFRQLEAMNSTSGATAAPMASAPPPATAVGVPGVVGPTAVRPLAEPPPWQPELLNVQHGGVLGRGRLRRRGHRRHGRRRGRAREEEEDVGRWRRGWFWRRGREREDDEVLRGADEAGDGASGGDAAAVPGGHREAGEGPHDPRGGVAEAGDGAPGARAGDPRAGARHGCYPRRRCALLHTEDHRADRPHAVHRRAGHYIHATAAAFAASRHAHRILRRASSSTTVVFTATCHTLAASTSTLATAAEAANNSYSSKRRP
uniref:Myb-like domain-containing protein n=1 Tax=Aegilops tauschii subsp. strangulata TaxID=200361 RepID=A0A452YIX0_AEGTS